MRSIKLFALGLTLIIIISACQKEEIFNSEKDLIQEYTALDNMFSEYKVVEIDNDGILDYSKKKHNQEFVLDLKISEKPSWVFSVNFYDFFSEDYKAFESNADGHWVEIIRTDRSDAYLGHSKDLESKAMFIMEDDLFTGNIFEGDEEYFMEPLSRFVKNASAKLYVYYPADADFEGRKATCDVPDEDFQGIQREDSAYTKANDICREVGITYVADFQYRQKFDDRSSLTRNYVENRIRYGSLRYHSYNGYPLQLILYRSYIRTSTNNPPSTSSSVRHARNEFAAWAPSNITRGDVNILFTGRRDPNYAGWTKFYTGCKSPNNAYAVINKRNGWSAWRFNNTVAHEVGHIFGCSHEGSGFMKRDASSSSMSSSTRHQLNSYIHWNNSCIPFKRCR